MKKTILSTIAILTIMAAEPLPQLVPANSQFLLTWDHFEHEIDDVFILYVGTNMVAKVFNPIDYRRVRFTNGVTSCEGIAPPLQAGTNIIFIVTRRIDGELSDPSTNFTFRALKKPLPPSEIRKL